MSDMTLLAVLRRTQHDPAPPPPALLIVQGTIQFSLGILAEAGLSYVGLGAQPPTPSWGRMLAEAQTMVTIAPHVAVIPGLCILLTVLGLIMVMFYQQPLLSLVSLVIAARGKPRRNGLRNRSPLVGERKGGAFGAALFACRPSPQLDSSARATLGSAEASKSRPRARSPCTTPAPGTVTGRRCRMSPVAPSRAAAEGSTSHREPDTGPV